MHISPTRLIRLPAVRQPDPAGPAEDAVQQLFELSLDLLGTASQDGFFTRLNPAWERTLGWTREQLMAEPFISFVHPDDVSATLASAAKRIHSDSGQTTGFENRYRTCWGEYRWLRWTTVTHGDAFYFVVRDVTEAKAKDRERERGLQQIRRSDLLHRTLSANLPDTSVFLLDRDLRILLADGEVARRLAWFSDDLFVGRSVPELYAEVPAEILTLCLEHFRAALRGERRSFESVSAGVSFEVQAVPIGADDGSVESVLVVARDVTGQRTLAQELSRSEARLVEAEQMVGVGSWELVLETGSMARSDGLSQILGIDPGDELGVDGFLARVHPEDRQLVSEAASRCLRTGRATVEYRIVRSDQTIRTLRSEGERVHAGPRGLRALRGAVVDVTDERAGFEGAPIGMLVAEPEQLRLLRANPALCSMLGRSREELLGLTLVELTHPEDHDHLWQTQQELLTGAAPSAEAETRFLLPDGGVMWASIYVTPVHRRDGSVRTYSAQIIDITERRNRTAEVHCARVESLRRLAVASAYHDNETQEHTDRVACLSARIGAALGMSPAQLEILRAAAPLHDVGKIGIPDTILLKPGPLVHEERQIMERHTLIGADILSGSESDVLKLAEQIALAHHERWDGQGYPHRLLGDSIPLAARIVAVADVFDALTHDRPYKQAWSVERAVEHIRDQAGRHFAPDIVTAFDEIIAEHPDRAD